LSPRGVAAARRKCLRTRSRVEIGGDWVRALAGAPTESCIAWASRRGRSPCRNSSVATNDFLYPFDVAPMDGLHLGGAALDWLACPTWVPPPASAMARIAGNCFSLSEALALRDGALERRFEPSPSGFHLGAALLKLKKGGCGAAMNCPPTMLCDCRS
jgi:hypothetical protein